MHIIDETRIVGKGITDSAYIQIRESHRIEARSQIDTPRSLFRLVDPGGDRHVVDIDRVCIELSLEHQRVPDSGTASEGLLSTCFGAPLEILGMPPSHFIAETTQ